MSFLSYELRAVSFELLELSALSSQLSAVSCQLSALSCQLSVLSCSAVSSQFPTPSFHASKNELVILSEAKNPLFLRAPLRPMERRASSPVHPNPVIATTAPHRNPSLCALRE